MITPEQIILKSEKGICSRKSVLGVHLEQFVLREQEIKVWDERDSWGKGYIVVVVELFSHVRLFEIQNVVHWRREWQTTSVFLPCKPNEHAAAAAAKALQSCSTLCDPVNILRGRKVIAQKGYIGQVISSLDFTLNEIRSHWKFWEKK